MAKGGARPGAGRPKGSGHKPHILDYMTEEDIKTYFQFILSTYMGDMRLATWIGDQISGKAPQAVDVTSNGKSLVVELSETIAKKNNVAHTDPEPSSG